MSKFTALGSDDGLFVVLHACFMVVAWVGAASTGILLARYFKKTWKGYKACNIDQWFHVGGQAFILDVLMFFINNIADLSEFIHIM